MEEITKKPILCSCGEEFLSYSLLNSHQGSCVLSHKDTFPCKGPTCKRKGVLEYVVRLNKNKCPSCGYDVSNELKIRDDHFYPKEIPAKVEPDLEKIKGKKKLKFVCISDTHELLKDLIRKDMIPDGDVLLHAGDFTMTGSWRDIKDFNDQLGKLPHPVKIVIAGNHDVTFESEREKAKALITNAVYLEDELYTVNGIRIWGSPYQPTFCDWAFNVDRGEPIAKIWKKIPDCDILLTHGPPKKYGGLCYDGFDAGCEELLKVIQQKKPKYNGMEYT
eukprot:TRINITY_DN4204_c0_g1_i2.p1 TRINITY_DN4204_c0_g1~~TRINITY_DN4204_c0_g1_i2.p1  ORF type:complete len:276 (-),score=37.28 TRINITY_DN4204_c0_g1_i2:96-923(-)